MELNAMASFSGGKDSTAMVLRLIEEDWPLDEIVFFDTGWEFPQMYEHIRRVESYIGRSITWLKPRRSFTYWMFHRPIVARQGTNKGKVHRIGNGWPSPTRRWCTREKVEVLDKYCKGTTQYIGIASDEAKRVQKSARHKSTLRYPLIDWDMSEDDCLQYCYDRGFDWDGLYRIFRRVSCFCCPLQRIGELRKLRAYYPMLWQRMLEWDGKIGDHNKGFRGYKTVHDLEARFAEEERQTVLAFARKHA